MSSSTTPDVPLAIRLENVNKTYRLYGSQRQQLMEILGLYRLGLGAAGQYKEFAALKNVSLSVPKGARVGVVGRNGAGKTTLLKLVCGNFAPTAGEVEVNGSVQALMGTGIGFHPEYTGRENAIASLQYNGLRRAEYDEALEDILDFCELSEFLDQPFKTYSLGMQARLMFATSTAVKPDILIVDEVLGAGDGYFIAKSRQRMEKLVSGGCTMLLVSHSTQQVLELCHHAVWLEKGEVRLQGEAFDVVKAYEEYVYGGRQAVAGLSKGEPKSYAKEPLRVLAGAPSSPQLQEPTFQPNTQELDGDLPEMNPSAMSHQARGGISRWESEPGVKVCGFEMLGSNGEPTNNLLTLAPARVVLHLQAEQSGAFNCRYGILINDLRGRSVAKLFSPRDHFTIQAGQIRRISIALNPLQLGPGDYTIGISVLDYAPLELLNATKRYDLLGRSFEFRVDVHESLAAADCLFYHSSEWTFG